MSVKKIFNSLSVSIAIFCLSGCSSILEKKGQHFANSFSSAILESDDPVMIEQGIPSYLLLLDALVKNNPEQTALWQAAASLNSAYAGNFIKDAGRVKKVNNKALQYAFTALCQRDKRLCQPRDLAVDDLTVILKQLDGKSLSTLYVAGSGWAARKATILRVFSMWRAMRRGSVSMPCRISQAVWGLMQAPKSRSPSRRARSRKAPSVLSSVNTMPWKPS